MTGLLLNSQHSSAAVCGRVNNNLDLAFQNYLNINRLAKEFEQIFQHYFHFSFRPLLHDASSLRAQRINVTILPLFIIPTAQCSNQHQVEHKNSFSRDICETEDKCQSYHQQLATICSRGRAYRLKAFLHKLSNCLSLNDFSFGEN